MRAISSVNLRGSFPTASRREIICEDYTLLFRSRSRDKDAPVILILKTSGPGE